MQYVGDPIPNNTVVLTWYQTIWKVNKYHLAVKRSKKLLLNDDE